MISWKSMTKRGLAFALALLLTLALVPGALAAGAQSVTLGDALANAYAGTLTAQEQAVVKKLETGRSFTYTAPGTDKVTVTCSSTDVFSITAQSYTDPDGNVWTPVSCKAILPNGMKKNVVLSGGKGSYTYTGNDSFTVEVTYSCSAKVPEAWKSEINEALALPQRMGEGIALLSAIESDILPRLNAVQKRITVLYNLAEFGTLKYETSLGSVTLSPPVDDAFKEAVGLLMEETGKTYNADKTEIVAAGNLKMIDLMSKGAALSTLLNSGSEIKENNDKLLGILKTITETETWAFFTDLAPSLDKTKYAEELEMIDALPGVQAEMEKLSKADWSAAEGSELFTDDKLLAAEAEFNAVDVSKIPAGREAIEVGASISALTKAVSVSAGHSFGDIVSEQPTCTEAGSHGGSVCADCGKTIEAGEIPALGHELTKVAAKAATAEAEGNIEYYKCDRCGKLFADSEGAKEITQADTVIARLSAEGWKLGAGGKWWYQYADGSYAKDGWASIGGKWYYFDGAGYMQTGWLKLGNDWYYLTGSGAMATGWAGGGGWWYFFDQNGVMQTGWVHDGSHWYFCDASGLMQLGWLKDGGKWYYMQPSGAMTTGWQGINGDWYWFDASGVMQTGWQVIGGKWYYLGADGAMSEGWETVNGQWYYFDASGAMQTGWVLADGSWYYLDDDTGAMRTGWLQLGDTWYWLHSSGAMAADETIGGYTFDGSGAWIA